MHIHIYIYIYMYILWAIGGTTVCARLGAFARGASSVRRQAGTYAFLNQGARPGDARSTLSRDLWDPWLLSAADGFHGSMGVYMHGIGTTRKCSEQLSYELDAQWVRFASHRIHLYRKLCYTLHCQCPSKSRRYLVGSIKLWITCVRSVFHSSR